MSPGRRLFLAGRSSLGLGSTPREWVLGGVLDNGVLAIERWGQLKL